MPKNEWVEPPAELLTGLLANDGAASEAAVADGVLARFHGAVEHLVPTYSFGVRQRLLHHFRDDAAVRLLHGNAQSNNVGAYWDELRASPFCLAPPGHARWSLRMTEAIVAGCVPVLFDVGALANPWERELNYSSFSLRVRRVGDLRQQLAEARSRLPEMHRARVRLPLRARLRLLCARDSGSFAGETPAPDPHRAPRTALHRWPTASSCGSSLSTPTTPRSCCLRSTSPSLTSTAAPAPSGALARRSRWRATRRPRCTRRPTS